MLVKQHEQFKWKHTIYIDWFHDSKKIILSKEEWNEMIDQLKSDKKKKIRFNKTIGNNYLTGNYFIESWNGYIQCYRFVNNEWITYKVLDNVCKQGTKVDTGDIAIKWQAKFKECNNGISANKLFGMTQGIKFRKFVPSAVIWSNDSKWVKNQILPNMHKADLKSAYGWAMSQPLPDTHTLKIESGIVQPSEEYPFVFYMNSGHHAVYNEYSTTTFKSRYYPQYNFNDKEFTHGSEISYCYKAIPQEFGYKDVVQYFYQLKESYPKGSKERDEMKNMLVVPTGMMRPTTVDNNDRLLPNAEKIYGLYIQAAVVLGRTVNRILNICKQLERENNLVVMIATDSVMWLGKHSSVAIEKQSGNELGTFEKEHTNCRVCIKATNNYMIEDNGLYVYKHMGRIDRKHSTLEEYQNDNGDDNGDIFEQLVYSAQVDKFVYVKKRYMQSSSREDEEE